MNRHGTHSLSTPCSFYEIGRSSQGHQKGRPQRRGEVHWVGGAPASSLRINIGRFYGNRRQYTTPDCKSRLALAPSNPTQRHVAPPQVPDESTALKVM